MKYPTFKDIVTTNKTLIKKYGGNFQEQNNLLNSGSLRWVLDAIQYPLFGVDQYPTIHHKAAILMWIISSGHVFTDGNKRTSFVAAATFLDRNRYRITATSDEVKQISLDVATRKKSGITFDVLVEWFILHTTKQE